MTGLLAHVEPELADLFHNVRACLPRSIGPKALSERLPLALSWLRTYLETGITDPPVPRAHVEVLDVGTNGFVYARAKGNLRDAWLQLYRAGHLRGVCTQSLDNGRLEVRAQKKSAHLALDLRAAAAALNAVENAMGEKDLWVVLNDVLLRSPTEGTRLRPEDVLNILIRALASPR